MLKSSKIIATLLTLAIASTTLLTGCGSKQQEPKATETKDPKSISATITFWAWADPNWKAANQAIIEKFEKEYPNIKVKYEEFPYDSYIPKMKAAYAAGNESDIQQIFGSFAPPYLRNELFDQVPADMLADAKSRFYDATLQGYSYNGKLYAMPRELNTEAGGVLYYPEELKKAGYDKFPATYDELLDVAQKLTQTDANGNITHYGFDFTGTDSVTFLFLSYLLQQGGNYWKEDGKHVNFSTPEAEKALQAMADLVMKYKVTDNKHTNPTTDTQDFFFRGSTAMCFRGPWVIQAGKSQYNLDNFQYGSMPTFAGNKYTFAIEPGWAEVVSANSKNKQAAWLFVKFSTSPENSALWNNLTNTLPADKNIVESPDFLKSKPLMKASVDVMANAVSVGPMQNMDTFKTIMYDNFKNITEGKQDIKTALKNIEDATNTMIDEQLSQ